MKIKDLEKVFQTLCESKANKLHVFSHDYSSSKKEAIFGMEFNQIRLEIVYTKKNKLFIPPSMIYVRIYFDKLSPIYYHLPEIFSFLEEYDFRACYFPYIENIYRMNSCFEALFELLNDYLEVFDHWNDQMKHELYEYQKAFLLKQFNETSVQEDDLMIFERDFYEKYYYLSRYSVFSGYYAFLQEDYSTAIKEYKKLARKETLSDYECQLLEYIETIETYDAIPQECFALHDIQPYLKSSKHDLKDILLFLLIIYFPSAFLSCLSLFTIQKILSINTLVYCGIEWWFGLVLGVLPALFGAIAFRREMMALLKYKNLIKAIDFDDILNSDVTNRFAYLSFALSCIVVFAFILICSFDSLRFYQDHLDVYQDDFIKRKVYFYEDVEKIYHIDARINDWDERIERESYILYFDNGDYLDLDGYTSIQVSENDILPLFDSEVIDVDSDADLEFISE